MVAGRGRTIRVRGLEEGLARRCERAPRRRVGPELLGPHAAGERRR